MVKLTRVLEVVRNAVEHMHKVHENASYESWNVDVEVKDSYIKINLKTPQWEEHKESIETALKKETHEEDHNF